MPRSARLITSRSATGGLVANGAGRAGSASKIWLDGRRRATLAESVPQVGAPAAWAAGFDGAAIDNARVAAWRDRYGITAEQEPAFAPRR